ncbi:glycosyl hydrolase [Ravibacter arvi]|uniref:Glycosyl hydrolase n=1 Tax=Ravibacter arvi TaxID=2051041 RepID=A0ABP8M0H9_9BACT
MMTSFRILSGFLRIGMLFCLLCTGLSFPLNAQTSFTTKPWTYWWWMGSAATPEDITWQMERFAEKGLGGVHIIPIYGVKGYEAAFVPFLKKKWLSLLEHTIQEGNRLGLGVDMTTGTGWPFGGPNVTPELAAKKWKLLPDSIVVSPTGQKVKRAAPGGEGLVLDPFGAGNMENYLQRFDSAFAGSRLLPRSMYNDSYEVYGGNWTQGFEEEFRKRRGYDFREAMAKLRVNGPDEEKTLARMDYQETISELVLENYARPWVSWSNRKGMKTRYQAHGSPGNLLDLYAEADIPETESFGNSGFSIPGLRVDTDYSVEKSGKPDPLAMKMASSPAHLKGKPLVSSETTTWLANHFKVSLSQAKPQIDELFVAGINHVFYHGTTYTPKREAFPGWLFYASTNYGPHAHFDKHFQYLNAYVTRIQSYLQPSQPENDILLYFPIHDLWATPAKEPEELISLGVHYTERWLTALPVGALAGRLWKRGFTFDYISDAQLALLNGVGGREVSAGHGRYKTILIPSGLYMPESTVRELLRLADQGVKIVFAGDVPGRATGLKGNRERSRLLVENMDRLLKKASVLHSGDWEKDLSSVGVNAESMAEKGLSFIRKSYKNQPFYFVANLADKFGEDWVKINLFSGSIVAIDPLTGEKQPLPVRETNAGREYFLDLPPGKSLMLLAGEQPVARAVPDMKTGSATLKGSWKLVFKEGRPGGLPEAGMETLQSWTTLSDSARYFSGTVAYSLVFDLPAGVPLDKTFELDLGDVREVADVQINGKPIGTVWSIPFRLSVPAGVLKKQKNLLVIEVTNLSANYMRLFDEVNPGWKKFYDINMIDISGKPFKASRWDPMPSGLLSEVRLGY